MRKQGLASILCGIGAAAALTALHAGAEETILNGCRVEPLELNVVETTPNHLNFCFATRYPDGVIHLNHSVGIHTVTERGCSDISTDNGKTWKHAPNGAAGINSFCNRDGKRVQISCWDADGKIGTKHKLDIRIFDDATGKFSSGSCEIELPYPSMFLLHRDVIRTRDGRLLATAYGRKKDARTFHVDMIESTDDGKTWHYLSLVAEDNEIRSEGPCEATIVELADGSILAIYRVDGNVPSRQRRSTDGGKTWGPEEKSVGFGASPQARLLSNGILAVVVGRPGLYLFLDVTGTGREYQRYAVYTGSTSSYASVLETAPDEVTVVYDESNFGANRSASPFARIMAARFKVQKGNFRRSSDDPRSKGYNVFYSPAQRKMPDELKIAYAQGYRKKAPENPAWAEIVAIPERPQPVLRLHSHGDAKTVSGSQWSQFSSSLVPDGTEKLEIGFEFRLGEADLKTPQFMVNGMVSPTGAGRWFGYAAFAVDRIQYLDNGVHKVLPYQIGTTKFHAFRMVIDGKTKKWQLYREGEDKPLLTADVTTTKGAGVNWGDGSAGIFGSADLSYIGWKY